MPNLAITDPCEPSLVDEATTAMAIGAPADEVDDTVEVEDVEEDDSLEISHSGDDDQTAGGYEFVTVVADVCQKEN